MSMYQRLRLEMHTAQQQLMMADTLQQKDYWDKRLSQLENELDDLIGVHPSNWSQDDGDLMSYKSEDVI
jgi:hypothetical protein